MLPRKIFRFAILIIAGSCCIYQIQSTLVPYFRYDSVSRMELVGTEVLELMSLSLCVPYLSFLDIKFGKQKFKVDLKHVLKSESDDYENKREVIEDKITVREILNQTFRSEEIITGCSMRFKSSRYFTVIKNSKPCYELFKARKYVTQDSICYLFEPKQINIPTSNYFTATMFPGVIYSLVLNSSFASRMRYYKFIVHSNVQLPHKSKYFAQVRRTSSPTNVRYNIQFSRHFLSLLSYPYTSYVCSRNKHANSECIEHCVMNETIRRYTRVAYDLDTETPYDFAAITKKQTLDSRFSSEVDALISNCSKRCRTRYCYFDYTSTWYDNDDFTSVAILVKTPNAPDTLITHMPRIYFLDLFVYCMGAIGSWFGFAFINIDPMVLVSFVKRRFQNTEQPQVITHRYRVRQNRTRNVTRSDVRNRNL